MGDIDGMKYIITHLAKSLDMLEWCWTKLKNASDLLNEMLTIIQKTLVFNHLDTAYFFYKKFHESQLLNKSENIKKLNKILKKYDVKFDSISTSG